MNDLKPFRFWCQKVLPLVYDESLSYYELLCKVVFYINKILENLNENLDDNEKLRKEFEFLKKWCEEYFENLNVDEEINQAINDKLDELVENGHFDNVLKNYFDQWTEQLQEWQEENLTRFAKLENNKNTPTSATAGTIQAIYKVFETYLRHNSELVYAHIPGDVNGQPPVTGENAMNYETGVDVATNEWGTGKAINCSGLVNLLLLGVPYEYSMYNQEMGKNNEIGRGGYSFNMWNETITADNYRNFYVTRKMAGRFRDLNLGFYPNSDFSNICAGDVIFFKDPSDDRDITESVNHVAICLHKHPTRYVAGDTSTALYTFMEVVTSANCVRTTIITSERCVARGICYIGRPVYTSVSENKELIAVMKGGANSVTFDVADKDIYTQDVLTLDFDYTPSSITSYVNVWTQTDIGINSYIRQFTTVNSGQVGKKQHLTLPFRITTTGVYDGDHSKVTSLRVTALNTENKGIENVSVWKGILSDVIKDDVFIVSSLTQLQNKILLLTDNSYSNYGEIINCGFYNTVDFTIPPFTFTSNSRWAQIKAAISSGKKVISVELGSTLISILGYYDGTTWVWKSNGTATATPQELNSALPKSGQGFCSLSWGSAPHNSTIFNVIYSPNQLLLIGSNDIYVLNRSNDSLKHTALE